MHSLKSFLLFLLFQLSFLFSFSSTILINKDPDYKKLWKTTDSLVEKGLTKSALEVVSNIYSIAVKEDNGPAISHKEENSKLTAYFLEILPDYDQERVYPSDIKKILNWYNMLQAKGLVSKEEPKIENAEEVLDKVVKEVAAEKADKPAKKTKSK